MKLESLKNGKFENSLLKKEQMVFLNGGLADVGTVTPGGSGCGNNVSASNPTVVYSFNYGYDSDRGNGFITYHNRTNVTTMDAEDCIGLT